MIKSVSVKNFMAHSDLEVKDIPTINLIIGKNDTGKTGLLKLLYSIVKSLEIYSKKVKTTGLIRNSLVIKNCSKQLIIH